MSRRKPQKERGCVGGAAALPVSRHVQHVQLGGVGELDGEFAEAVVPQREHVEAGAAPQLFGHVAQTVAVYIQVGQLLQLAQRARKRLERKGEKVIVGLSGHQTSPIDRHRHHHSTCNRFSVKTSSVRFSHSPIDSLRRVSRFWSTFRMDSCFKLPRKQNQTCRDAQKTVNV